MSHGNAQAQGAGMGDAAPELSTQVGQLPHKPGVYLFRDRFNRVIYVGKARDLHKRVSQYFHPSRRQAAEPKTRALVEAICGIETHVVRSEAEAVLLEGRLIKEYRPRYNISFRDDKRFLMVKINMNDPFPRFALTRLRKEDGARYFGPFAHSGALRSTLNVIRRKFGLRSCRSHEPGERDFKHCLDHVIKNCAAPCVGRITRADYVARVEEACEFLEGRCRAMVEELRQEMERAAASLDFERAAQLRDLVDDLRKTTQAKRKFERSVPSTVIPDRDTDALREALRLPRRPDWIECFDISNISTTHKVASLVVFRQGRPDRSNYRRFRIRTVEGQDDFASMQEVITRRYSRVLGLREGTAPDAVDRERLPHLIVVDGGRGQVSAAVKAFRALGVAPPPLIGLAKQREEIFYPSSSEPLVLARDNPALRLLQRVRDEAHRFANAFHQLLLRRRVTESLLDDIPGVSAQRKAMLLERLGSVDRIRRASVEELAAIPGISRRLAETIRLRLASPEEDPRHSP